MEAGCASIFIPLPLRSQAAGSGAETRIKNVEVRAKTFPCDLTPQPILAKDSSHFTPLRHRPLKNAWPQGGCCCGIEKLSLMALFQLYI